MTKDKYSWNKFKQQVSSMTDAEKQDMVKELHIVLMAEIVKAKQSLSHMDCGFIRKQIAFLKTVLNNPGYHYNPRR